MNQAITLEYLRNVAVAIANALSADGGAEMDEGDLVDAMELGKTQGFLKTHGFLFSLEQVDRDYAWEPSTIISALDAEGVDLGLGGKAPVVTAHLVVPAAEGWNYSTFITFGDTPIGMILTATPGEYCDDNYDLYVSVNLSLHESVEARDQYLLNSQIEEVRQVFGYMRNAMKEVIQSTDKSLLPNIIELIASFNSEMGGLLHQAITAGEEEMSTGAETR